MISHRFPWSFLATESSNFVQRVNNRCGVNWRRNVYFIYIHFMYMLKIFFIDRSLYLIESVPCSRKKESTIRNKNRWIYIYISVDFEVASICYSINILFVSASWLLSVDLSAFFVQGGRVIVFLRRVGRGTSALRLIFARSTPRRSTGMAHRGKLLRCLHDKSGERAVGTWYPVDRSRCSDSLLSRGHTSVVPLPHTRARARALLELLLVTLPLFSTLSPCNF